MLIFGMQLDKFTDYGLRALIYLRLCGARRASVAEIAAKFHLSEHHLSKVATALAADGFVVSSRGRAGGLSLAKPARDISIGAVVRRLTRNVAVAECFAQNGACAISPACGLRGPLAEAQEAFFKVLDGYNLADVSGQGAALSKLLGVDDPSALDETV
ncbi:transcriptional regulator, BadM/Rrf2 family [Litoreibacter albidus]|uniref:Transcriptional regulator, BadM/Rrf2 family n=2 Tax=Litoreibacter albidus TaxID=670155 RepID=A0A1H2QSN2_9RHOB|nr:transcriptional regulator, BadM/Rrf2 family [Litoreibacter albidus]